MTTIRATKFISKEATRIRGRLIQGRVPALFSWRNLDLIVSVRR